MCRSCGFTKPGGRSAAAGFQVVRREEEKEEDTLLLAASQQFEKRCGPLMMNEDIQSAVLGQVPANTKQSNNWAASTWPAQAIGSNASYVLFWSLNHLRQ